MVKNSENKGIKAEDTKAPEVKPEPKKEKKNTVTVQAAHGPIREGGHTWKIGETFEVAPDRVKALGDVVFSGKDVLEGEQLRKHIQKVAEGK